MCVDCRKEGYIMKKIQLGKEVVLNDADLCVVLKYYVTECPVGFGYSKLKCYGAEVEKTEKRPGMNDIRECKSIDGIFFDAKEAISFMTLIKKNKIEPSELMPILEKYIKETIKMHREENEVKVK